MAAQDVDTSLLATEGRDVARYSWLLAAMLVLLAVPPLLNAAGIGHLPGGRFSYTAVLIASLFTVTRHPLVRWLAIALAVPSVVLDWASLLAESRLLALIGASSSMAFLSVVIAALSGALMRSTRVTADTILGGVCLYLLLAVWWTFAYSILEILTPGSILAGGELLHQLPGAADEPFRNEALLYFSFVTITTLGYGDILPVSEAARSLAAGEAVVGQLYIAVFVARLVGMHLAQSRND